MIAIEVLKKCSGRYFRDEGSKTEIVWVTRNEKKGTTALRDIIK
jgi:hypothetical protein